MNILTADFGTTSLKVSVFDSELHCLSRSQQEYALLTTSEGYIELAPERYWTLLCEGIRACCAALPAPGQIAGIVLTTQGETLIAVDCNGVPLRNAIVWLDSRAQQESVHVRSLISADAFYQHTGISNCDATCPICKVLWLKNNEPELYTRSHRLLLLEDYLIFRLTGCFVTEKSLMSTTGYYDIYHDCMFHSLLAQCNLDATRFPEVLDCGTAVADLTPEAAEATGLPASVTVFTGAMDQVCAAIGAGVTVPGILSENTGTAMVLGAVADRSALETPPHVTVYRHAYADTYLLMPICMTGGIFLKWFKDEFCLAEQQQSRADGVNVYNLLDQLAENSPAGSRGLLALPYLNGCPQPQVLPNNSGVFYGIGLSHTRSDFVRAILEAVGYMLQENVTLIEQKSGTQIRQIYSCGGGSQSDLWCQIKADILHRTVVRPKESELTSLGAAMLVLGMRSPASPPATDIFSPNPALQGCYDSIYQKYCSLIKALWGTSPVADTPE